MEWVRRYALKKVSEVVSVKNLWVGSFPPWLQASVQEQSYTPNYRRDSQLTKRSLLHIWFIWENPHKNQTWLNGMVKVLRECLFRLIFQYYYRIWQVKMGRTQLQTDRRHGIIWQVGHFSCRIFGWSDTPGGRIWTQVKQRTYKRTKNKWFSPDVLLSWSN